MEGSGTGIGRLDCYEDMFKEITRKLYGEDPDHRTSSVQNEFEASVSYKNDDDTGNGTDGSDDGNWTYEEEPLKGTDGSRIASYHAGKTTWRCDECGDVMGGGPREIAEHFMELHSARILADNNRNRHHSPRKDYLQMDLKVEDVVLYLDRLRERAERAAPPSRRTQETQTVPAALLPVTSNFLLQELPSAPLPQHLQQIYNKLSQNTVTVATSATTSASGKRYTCPYCPYGTDRRDLYTRHENIHREEKPFHCYVCSKPFNRADHVKKHFLRMHREHPYDLSRIRRPAGTTASKPLQQDSGTTTAAATANASGQQQPQQQHLNYQSSFASNKGYQLQPNAATSATGTSTIGIYQTTTMPAPGIMQPDANNCNTGRRVPNGGCNSKSHLKGGSKSAQERRYTCMYCSWSGVDNWCLKRHMNTHTKPFGCTLCEYKAARAERLATHVLKVHNRRQCSRCPFLAEDAAQLQMHQLHVHRVSSASAPSTSTTQTAPPPSNRHQQPLHPVGGGRPPPGPPVFPAPAPAIAPATTVIPPSTILGHEMVKSPATAATMAYPTEEEKRSHRRIGGINGDDNDGNDDDDVVRGNGNREELNRDLGVCRVCGFKCGRNDDLEPCSCDHSNGSSMNGATDTSNHDFTCSYQLPSLPRREANAEQPSPGPSRDYARQDEKENRERPRKRKQSKPRQVIWHHDERTDIESISLIPALGSGNKIIVIPNGISNDSGKIKMSSERQQRSSEQQKLVKQRMLRCHLCPKYAPARGISHRPYHNRASLTLHKLWRHNRGSWSAKNPVSRVSQPSTISSITLKATFFTSPNYRYHR